MKEPSAPGGPQLTRVILFVSNVPQVADFYQRFFEFHPVPGSTEEWTELASVSGGCNIALHKTTAAKPKCTTVKLVFGIADVRAFKLAKVKDGLRFGVVHKAEGFEFSHAKDPAGNTIQISSRAML